MPKNLARILKDVSSASPPTTRLPSRFLSRQNQSSPGVMGRDGRGPALTLTQTRTYLTRRTSPCRPLPPLPPFATTSSAPTVPHSTYTPATLRQFARLLTSHNLAPRLVASEVLACVNLRPKDALEVELVIEDAEKRFTPAELEALVEVVRECFGSDEEARMREELAGEVGEKGEEGEGNGEGDEGSRVAVGETATEGT